MFAVAGVTGQTGSVVAATLLERKQPVRVIVRTTEKGATWKAKGAQVAVASLEDAQALPKAWSVVTRAYVVLPPTYRVSPYMDDRKTAAAAIAPPVQSSGLRHVVLLSSTGGHLATETRPLRALHYAERRLAPVAPSLTIL